MKSDSVSDKIYKSFTPKTSSNQKLSLLLTFIITLTSIFDIVTGLLLCLYETRWTSCWIGSMLILFGLSKLSFFKKSISYTESYTYFLRIGAILTVAHFLAALMAHSRIIMMNKPFVNVALTSCLLISSLINWSCYYCHKSISNETDCINTDISIPKWRRHTFYAVSGLVSMISWAFGELRIQHGHFPIPSPIEGLILMGSSAFILTMESRRLRQNKKMCIGYLCYMAAAALMTAFSFVLYFVRANTRQLHIQYGTSILIMVWNLFSILVALVMRTAILEEPIIIRTSKPESIDRIKVDSTESQLTMTSVKLANFV